MEFLSSINLLYSLFARCLQLQFISKFNLIIVLKSSLEILSGIKIKIPGKYPRIFKEFFYKIAIDTMDKNRMLHERK